MRAANLNILILAAGSSTRFGKPKAMARIRGVSLLRRALALGASMAPRQIFAVVPTRSGRYRNEAVGIPVRFVPNARRAEGLASSVRIGVQHARHAAAILILPVDLYALEARDLHRLLARWRAAPGRVIAARIGAHGGIPLILPARLFAAAAQLQGDAGFRTLLSRHGPAPVLVDLPAAHLDIDTQEDLRTARRRRRRAEGSPFS